MTNKQLLKNVSNPKNWYYAIQGKYRRFIKRQYNKYFSDDNIDRALYAVYKCPKCYENNIMECCGCNFNEAVFTGKKCKNEKW